MSDAEYTGPRLVVGLGNPGEGYARNRHNIGFMVVDLLAQRIGAKFKAHKSRAQVAEGRLSGQRVVLAKPMTFMNLSGGPTTALRDFYKAPTSAIIAVHDELDVDYAALRLKLGGGDNGHNGLKSITKSLGPEYYRVRCGIGRRRAGWRSPTSCSRTSRPLSARSWTGSSTGPPTRWRPCCRRAWSGPRTPTTPDGLIKTF